tara:strand:+ start:636 stop:1505 length:870 start_codon:yes stop_codon:yes gene_type:complete
MPLVFAIIGDMGTGDHNQYQVGRALSNNLKKNDIKYVIGLGDNIYQEGCTSVTDKQFIKKFEKPYQNIDNNIKFYMVIGNHDYGSYWERLWKPCWKVQIEYGILSQKNNMKWYMPHNYYMISEKKNGCHIDYFFIDTNIDLMDKELEKKQLRDISKMIRSSTSNWKILVGHHTFRSIAGHGNAEPYLESYLKKIMRLGIDIYMCGHDHTKQVIEYTLNNKVITCIVCGSGGKKYDYILNLENVKDDKYSELIWNKETLGFGTCFATPKHMRIEFYNEKNKLEYKHNISK